MANNERLRILTVSLEGLQNTMTELIERILIFLNDFDVILLQETHVGHNSYPVFTGILELSLSETIRNDTLLFRNIEENIVTTRNNFRFHNDIKFYLTHFWSNKRGAGIIINTSHTVIRKFYKDGTYIGICANIEGRQYTFVSVYYHSRDKRNVLEQCQRDINNYQQGVLVIGGVFNVTLTELDVKDDKKHRLKRREMFRHIWQYEDVWRSRNVDKTEYTFRSHHLTESGENQEARLDYFFMRNNQLSLVEDCIIHTEREGFQHKQVSLTIRHPAPNGNPHDPPHDLPHEQPPEPEPDSNYESNLKQMTKDVEKLNINDNKK